MWKNSIESISLSLRPNALPLSYKDDVKTSTSSYLLAMLQQQHMTRVRRAMLYIVQVAQWSGLMRNANNNCSITDLNTFSLCSQYANTLKIQKFQIPKLKACKIFYKKNSKNNIYRFMTQKD